MLNHFASRKSTNLHEKWPRLEVGCSKLRKNAQKFRAPVQLNWSVLQFDLSVREGVQGVCSTRCVTIWTWKTKQAFHWFCLRWSRLPAEYKRVSSSHSNGVTCDKCRAERKDKERRHFNVTARRGKPEREESRKAAAPTLFLVDTYIPGVIRSFSEFSSRALQKPAQGPRSERGVAHFERELARRQPLKS